MKNFATNTISANTANALEAGIDIAKRVHQIHAHDKETGELIRLQLNTEELYAFFDGRPRSHIALEACGGSQYIARRFLAMGHDVELLHPKAVKPFVQGGKSDKNDAAGIYAAMRQPHVTRVGIKSIETQNISSMLTIREGVVKEKVIHINRVHGILLEYGIVVSKGKKFTQEAEKALETLGERCGQNAFLLQEIQDEIQAVRDCIKRLNRLENALEKMLEGNEMAQLFMTVPYVSTITAAAIVSSMPNPRAFRNARAYAASLGLVPGHTGSGGKIIPLGITKRGDKLLRKLLVQVAISFSYHVREEERPSYFTRLLKKPKLLGYVAIAAHLARSLWAMAMKKEAFKYDIALTMKKA